MSAVGEVSTGRELTRFCVKIFARAEVDDLKPAVGLFHRWIQQSAVPGLLIDVVDYRHVPDGPAVQLIGHEGDYLLDRAEGPLGLSYNRKRGPDVGSSSFLDALRNALTACAALEREPSLGFKFDAGRLRFIANDRLSMANDEAGALRARSLLQQAWAGALDIIGGSLERVENDPRSRLTIDVRAPKPVEISHLLERLGV